MSIEWNILDTGTRSAEENMRLDSELLETLDQHANELIKKRDEDASRDAIRAHYAVGMIFAGDTPGSPFGEFAVASDIQRLESVLRFSLRPVYEPRSSFRELRERPSGQGQQQRALRSNAGLNPGVQAADPRGGGPQPDLEPGQTSSGNRGGGG